MFVRLLLSGTYLRAAAPAAAIPTVVAPPSTATALPTEAVSSRTINDSSFASAKLQPATEKVIEIIKVDSRRYH